MTKTILLALVLVAAISVVGTQSAFAFAGSGPGGGNGVNGGSAPNPCSQPSVGEHNPLCSPTGFGFGRGFGGW